MSLKQATSGPVLFVQGGKSTIATFNSRVFSQTDNAYDFFDKNKIWHGYLYTNLTGAITADPSHAFYVGPCNEVTFQPIGSVTFTVLGSLDGVTFVTANTVTSADGFTRIQSKYRYLQVTVASASGPASIYMMIS